MTNEERLEQVRKMHAAARPNIGNIAWWNTHEDRGFLLQQLDAALLRLGESEKRLEAANKRYADTVAALTEEIASRQSRLGAVASLCEQATRYHGAVTFADAIKGALIGHAPVVENRVSKVPAEQYTDEPVQPVNAQHPLFERIWQAIKEWDIERTRGRGYAGATGTDVQAIIDAIEHG